MEKIGNRVAELIVAQLEGTITKAERKELADWVLQSGENKALYHDLTDQNQLHTEASRFLDTKQRALQQIRDMVPELSVAPPMAVRRHMRRRTYAWTAAAAILLLLSVGAYYWQTSSNKNTIAKNNVSKKPLVKDLPPGGNRAILRLSNGSSIVLDSARNGVLSKQDGADVVKTQDGKLSYNALIEKPVQVQFNILETPRGGQYQLVLADGSKVWLNAASSLKYPTAFIGNERRVELTGEAYFEIAASYRSSSNQSKKEKIPFIVSVNGMDVTVLGTHFNVNAYPDESVKTTTLLEGSVKIVNDQDIVTLHPGEQARVSTNMRQHEKIKLIKNADMDEAVSWKNGITSFKDANIQTIMRKVSRWYDVDVVYEGAVPERTFRGGISRTSNLSQLLKVLELSKIHFELLNENKLMVKP